MFELCWVGCSTWWLATRSIRELIAHYTLRLLSLINSPNFHVTRKNRIFWRLRIKTYAQNIPKILLEMTFFESFLAFNYLNWKVGIESLCLTYYRFFSMIIQIWPFLTSLKTFWPLMTSKNLELTVVTVFVEIIF